MLFSLTALTYVTAFFVPSTPPTRQAARQLVANPEFMHRVEVDAVAAFVGGSLGVVGTLISYEWRRYYARTRVACPYCQGRGSLTCAACLGTDPNCPSCTGNFRIKCVNCEATGLAIPPHLERKDVKNVDDELETKLDQIGIAAMADDLLRNEARPGDADELNAMLARRADLLRRTSAKKNLG